MFEEKTIAAISTPPGKGGIAIIRMSGPKAFSIGKAVFSYKKPFEKIKSHSMVYGKIIEDQQTLDQVLLVKMKKPKTYTKEDMVEIHCHGGYAVVEVILNLLFTKGAHPAKPGEFTKRAFLNGRIDLSQAEATMDLINAETQLSEKSAVMQMEGRTGKTIKQAREKIIDLLSDINAAIDYPEYDIEEISVKKAGEQASEIRIFLEKIIENYHTGRIVREGINVTIYGPPNAGKSTLINLAAGEEKAIVTDRPGTTRDVIEVHTSVKGIPVIFHDTAGIRKTENQIEKIGIQRTLNILEKADVAILVLDAKKGMDEETRYIVESIKKEQVIYVINKTDLASHSKLEEEIKKMGADHVIEACFIKEKGVEEIFEKLISFYKLGKVDVSRVLVTNTRHKSLVDQAILQLKQVEEAAQKEVFLDFLAVDLIGAAETLGKITGETAAEDVIKKIFEKFCLGK